MAHFIGKAEETLGGESKRPDGHRCVNFFAEPLELHAGARAVRRGVDPVVRGAPH